MALATDLDIRLNTTVRQVRYGPKGVEVDAVPSGNRGANVTPTTFKGMYYILANYFSFYVF